MMRSMYSGVAGLKVHQTKMDVIGNNIANVNTIGFNSVICFIRHPRLQADQMKREQRVVQMQDR